MVMRLLLWMIRLLLNEGGLFFNGNDLFLIVFSLLNGIFMVEV